MKLEKIGPTLNAVRAKGFTCLISYSNSAGALCVRVTTSAQN